MTRTDVSPRPTDAELGILNVLWERGPSTVRDVHEALYRDEGAGYTTALKLMQIMHAKGLVLRDDSERAHVFRAAVSRERTQKRFVAEMVQRVFNGSPSQLVLQALGGRAGQTPIVAMSADALPRQVERCYAAGMVDHIPKPVQREALYAKVERWRRKPAA